MAMSTALFAQTRVTTADGGVPKDLVADATPRDLADVQSVMLEAYRSKELAEINAQIDALLEKREELMFEVASKRHPHLGERIKSVAGHYRAQKQRDRRGH